MSNDLKLLEAALRMALKDPGSVGQRGLSLVLGASRIPMAGVGFQRKPPVVSRA